ncbi:MAG: acyltransferase [Clostridia bacterium]|nr:acyltransferase [Clostridia bacterium]
MKMLKKIIRRFKFYYANRSMPTKAEYLRKQGAKIGKGTRLNCSTTAFGSEPYLIEVGEMSYFSAGVQLFTHDGGVMTLNNMGFFDGKEMDKMGRIKIGNNVYIGTNAMVLPDVTIGDNCVIGAGAIVTKNIPSGSVAAGVPAKVICSVEEYGKRAKSKIYPTMGMPFLEKKKFLMENVK